MGDLPEGIRGALDYIEENLAGELDIREIAKQACVSPFYFQRIFTALCGISVGEYIRNRRLTRAGEELLTTEAKVIDIGAKYGYESPDSFARAFHRFHGLSPSAARKSGASLRAFAPLKIKLTLEGGTMLEYRIEEKPRFTLVGLSRTFHADTSYQEIPKFWCEAMEMENAPVCGTFGICMDLDESSKEFEYLIADIYLPWQAVPKGCVTKVIPASTWAVFPCRGPLPEALQDVNTRMWSEWLPNCRNYRLAANLNIEFYTPMPADPKDAYTEIWLPVERV